MMLCSCTHMSAVGVKGLSLQMWNCWVFLSTPRRSDGSWQAVCYCVQRWRQSTVGQQRRAQSGGDGSGHPGAPRHHQGHVLCLMTGDTWSVDNEQWRLWRGLLHRHTQYCTVWVTFSRVLNSQTQLYRYEDVKSRSLFGLVEWDVCSTCAKSWESVTVKLPTYVVWGLRCASLSED